MWRNYLMVGLRALLRSRIYAFINLFGLATGLAACLLLLVYVNYERTYDEWLPGAADVYQLQSHASDPTTGQRFYLQMSQFVAGTALKNDFPQVEARVAVLPGNRTVLRGGEAMTVEDAAFVDGPFLQVIALPLARGDTASALARPGDVVLSQAEALRQFGTEDVVGRTLTLVQLGRHVDYRIGGVFRDLPRNSHMRFRMILRADFASLFADSPSVLTSWGEIDGYNYVRLRPGTDVAAIHAQMPAWERRNIPPQAAASGGGGENQDWRLVNVRDVHLGVAQEGTMAPGNDQRTITTFTIVAFLILFMACVNFVNLATARASKRAREVALRKVLGANRRQLITQFIGESMLLTTAAMLIALAAAELLLPALSRFLDADLALGYFGPHGMLVPVVLLTLIVGMAGGLYPALYISRFQPAAILKANKSSADAAGAGLVRNILVVAQFAVSIGLIICTSMVYAQTVHARSVDPGFRRDGILQVENLSARLVAPLAESLSREIGRLPGVLSVGRSAIGVSTGSTMGRAVTVPGRSEPINIGNYAVDENFFGTMGIERVAGRLFDPARPTDRIDAPFVVSMADQTALVQRGGNVVVNELAARRLGFANPADAVGRQVRVDLFPFGESAGKVPVTIVGVVRDTRFRSIRTPIEPIMYRFGTDYQDYLEVRYEPGQAEAVRQRIQALWQRMVPDVPFTARFSEEIVAELYNAEQSRAEAFAGFAGLAILVACLGLFGLAAFTAERRTKEIGIRKVLGARASDIVRLLAWQFSKPVIIANLIAWPAAWWVMRDWLNTFDTRIALGPTPFLLAGLVALAIAIGTVAGHAIRVARANPIVALRYE